jgi:hypothetical protein
MSLAKSCKVLLELVEIGAVPREKPLPAVLAMVLMDQRLVVVAVPIVGVIVEVVDPAEGVAQPVDFGLAEAIEVGALARLALAIGVTAQARLNSSSTTLARSHSGFAISSGKPPRSSARQPSSIHSAIKAISASATRLPPHICGGNRLPSNGAAPRKPRISPEAALRLSGSPQHDASTAGAIRRTP